MPPDPQMCKVVLHCRCGNTAALCLRLRHGVPNAVRCDHPGHGGGGSSACRCGASWPRNLDALVKHVEDLLHRRVREWAALGAVHVDVDAVRRAA